MVQRYTCFIAVDSGNYTFAAMRPEAEGINVLHSDYEKLEQENARLRKALHRIVDGIPAYHEGSFVTLHHDGDGNEMGFEHHDPFAIIQSIIGVAESALQAQP